MPVTTDNMSVDTAGGEETVASDYVGSAQHQLVKPIFGDGDTATRVIKANATTEGPLPVNAYPASDFLMVAGLGLTPKFAAISLSGSGDVVDAVSTKKIRVVALFGFGTTTGTIKFQSNADSDLTGPMKVNDGTPLAPPFCPFGLFETVAGEKLNAVLTSMTAFNGWIVYVEV